MALRYLRTNKNPKATREDATNFLEGAQTTIHLASHSKEGLEALKGLQKKLKKKES